MVWMILAGLCVVVPFALFVHPFLAITKRVDADVLVVEGWIPAYMMPSVADEFRRGNYSRVLVSGLQDDPSTDPSGANSDALRTTLRLAEAGVPRTVLVPCPTPFARWQRTAKTARAVREKTAELNFKPTGINVVTAGPHARETWVAYQHAFGRTAPVGIISIPKTSYPAERWWTSRQGLVWVPKDFLGWLKEVVLGRRA
jgi:hypothetical protein